MSLNETRADFPTHKFTVNGKDTECLVPFSSDIKFNLFIRDMKKDDQNLRVYMKGAPERILGRCSKILVNGEQIDFTGKNVAIIGTGSSSIQTIPEIAKDVKNLYVFQRTPNYSIPSNNGPMDVEVEKNVKSRYSEFRKENYLNGFGIASDSGEAFSGF